ncbi:MAG: GTP pyrophosphokinase family protein [Lachnospiraceae bacterium]|nr:GTP pyrophosphokinase family protein [Lachnospiraceae bacterium]
MEHSIYGDHLPEMQALLDQIMEGLGGLRKQMTEQYGSDPVEHCLARIKSEESMREKCRRKGLPETPESALTKIHDAIGIRVVCAFLSDVYRIRDFLISYENAEIYEEKDYIRHVKPNGYRSYHMILLFNKKYYVEFQLRTISMDTWAALEHQIKYKHDVHGNEDLIVSELKRCADELASTDVSMQTIRDMIFEENARNQ